MNLRDGGSFLEHDGDEGDDMKTFECYRIPDRADAAKARGQGRSASSALARYGVPQQGNEGWRNPLGRQTRRADRPGDRGGAGSRRVPARRRASAQARRGACQLGRFPIHAAASPIGWGISLSDRIN